MPDTIVAASPSAHAAAERLNELLDESKAFIAPDRARAVMAKWIPRHGLDELSEYRIIAMMADAVLLAGDLLSSQPTAGGSTAFDRLARARRGAPPREAAEIAALGRARFRLFGLDHESPDPDPSVVPAHDLITGQRLRIAGVHLPPLARDAPLFARVVMLEDGLCCLAGALTPLDRAARAAAGAHPSAGATSVAGNARWAEAVYQHVVRHGTMDVPGLNRPRADFDDAEPAWPDDDEENEVLALALDWQALGEAAPDEDLIARTRVLVTVEDICEALLGALLARATDHASLADGAERMLLVQLETVQRRAQGGVAGLTLDSIGDVVNQAVASGALPPEAATLFTALRQRLPGGARAAADPALDRLLQRIQALRAKTVAQGCTEQEALAAAEKVAELLDRHGLSLSELDFRAQPCDGIGIQTSRRRFAPIDRCMPAIAAFFDCRVWAEHAPGTALRYVFFGLRGDVTAAQYLYEMVERAFETETTAFRAGRLYGGMGSDRRRATNSFQVGLARGICGKLDALLAARGATRRSASGRDLVPIKAAMVDEEVAKLGLNLTTRAAGGPRQVLSDAFQAGKAAGERFEVTPAITRAA